MSKPLSILWHELGSHLPYSVFATAGGIILAGIMLYMAILVSNAVPAVEGGASPALSAHEHEHGDHDELVSGGALMARASPVTFHVFHPVHMLFSAIATTAMFWRYDRKLLKAILTGLIGSLGVCSLSDVMMPYLSGLLLGTHMTFHWCLIQHPMLVLPFALVGVAIGILCAATVRQSTYFSHSAHVFVSSAASIFYLVSFGLTNWAERLGSVFILMVLAVTIPCCTSDVIFPLLVASKEGCSPHEGGHAQHHH